MAAWLLLVLIAQFLNAVVALVDKYILASGAVPRPIAYAFYLSLLSALSIGVFFFSWVPIPLAGVTIPNIANIEMPTVPILWESFFSGVALFGALVALFSAFKRADASDVIPVVGACAALATLILSYLFLRTGLTDNFLIGFLLLVGGMFILSLYRFRFRTLLVSILSGFLFAVHFVWLKTLFADTSFDNAFFWSRAGIVSVAIFVLFIPQLRKHITVSSSMKLHHAGALVAGNKILAGLASIMLLKAIELGDVSVVQALGGLQYAFLLVLTALFSKSVVKACGENCNRSDIIQKSVAVGIIMLGVGILFI